MGQKTRILFVTDLHGSTRAFRKFLNALPIYKADVGIIGGDLTGKVLIPITKQTDGSSLAEFNGLKYNITSDASMKEVIQTIEASGYYPFQTTADEVEELSSDPSVFDEMFKNLRCKRLEEWTETARTRLRDSQTKVYITGGNDDSFDIDAILSKSDSLNFAESKKEILLGEHEMISTGYSNMTPWKQFRSGQRRP